MSSLGTYKILAINPGSTSTKIALFENENEIFSEEMVHTAEEIKNYPTINAQYDFRKGLVIETLKKHGYSTDDIDAYAARGGRMFRCPGGTFAVNDVMLAETGLDKPMDHACTLAAHMANEFMKGSGKHRAFVVNPPTVDEFIDEARITGFQDVFRESGIHALNQKEVAIRYAASVERSYADLNLVVAHVGGGITVTAHRKGRMIDSSAIMAGEGPMTPTRSGTIPLKGFTELAFSGKYSKKQLWDRVTKYGGLIDHLGTSDVREVLTRIEAGDRYAKLIYDAMIYQIAKYVGSMAVALGGCVDGIILTGGIVRDRYFVQSVAGQTKWIAPIKVFAGEFEMKALAAGALRVLLGREKAVEYTGMPVWTPDSLRKNGCRGV